MPLHRPAGAVRRGDHLSTAGQVELNHQTPGRDGNTPLVTTPLEPMLQLAAPAPQSGLQLIRLDVAQLRCANHGVSALSAMPWPRAVPQRPDLQVQVIKAAAASKCETLTGRAGVDLDGSAWRG